MYIAREPLPSPDLYHLNLLFGGRNFKLQASSIEPITNGKCTLSLAQNDAHVAHITSVLSRLGSIPDWVQTIKCRIGASQADASESVPFL